MSRTERDERLAYAKAHANEYRSSLGALADSPYSPWDMAEFAALSANSPFTRARAAWRATRGVHGVQEIAKTLQVCGVGPTTLKAEYCEGIRGLSLTELPRPPYAAHRAGHPIRGLGYSKYSFAACLIDPLGADVVCIDTWMYQAYNGRVPDAGWFRRPAAYVALEGVIVSEAHVVNLPPFAYQWAVWDLARGVRTSHEFLWEPHRA